MTILPIPAPDEATDGPLDREPAPVDSRHLPSALHTAPGATPARVASLARLGRLARRDDRGQATAEYGLVILVAGLIALGVIAWAQGTGSFTDMFEGIINTLTSSV
jgi:Flp pilus assembly pilin Flp